MWLLSSQSPVEVRSALYCLGYARAKGSMLYCQPDIACHFPLKRTDSLLQENDRELIE
jgi:hypothetical protein